MEVSVIVDIYTVVWVSLFEALATFAVCIEQNLGPAMAIVTVSTAILYQMVNQPWKDATGLVSSRVCVRWQSKPVGGQPFLTGACF